MHYYQHYYHRCCCCCCCYYYYYYHYHYYLIVLLPIVTICNQHQKRINLIKPQPQPQQINRYHNNNSNNYNYYNNNNNNENLANSNSNIQIRCYRNQSTDSNNNNIDRVNSNRPTTKRLLPAKRQEIPGAHTLGPLIITGLITSNLVKAGAERILSSSALVVDDNYHSGQRPPLPHQTHRRAVSSFVVANLSGTINPLDTEEPLAWYQGTQATLLIILSTTILILFTHTIIITIIRKCLSQIYFAIFHPAVYHHIIMPTDRFLRVYRKAWMGGGNRNNNNNQERRFNNIQNNNNNNNNINPVSSSNNQEHNDHNNNNNNSVSSTSNSNNYIIDYNNISSRARSFMDNLRILASCSNNLDNSNSSSSASNSGASSRNENDASDHLNKRSNSRQYLSITNHNTNSSTRDQHDDDYKIYRFQALKFSEIHPKSSKNPKARSGHRMVADDKGDLYSFGGFNVKIARDDFELSEDPFWQTYNPLFRELWKYNWRTQKWQKLFTQGDVPEKLVSHCMGYVNDKLIIYGGTGLPFGENSSNKLTIYDIKRNYWETVRPVSDPSLTPHEMYGQAMAIDEKRGDIYIIGGTNGFRYNLDVHKFNLYNKKWTPLFRTTEFEHDPGNRYRHEIAFYNNKLFLFGGGTNNQCYSLKTLPVFDLETCDWSFLRTTPYRIGRTDFFPEARKCHSLAVLNKDCYVCGGTGGPQICPDIWHIDLETLKWTLIVRRIPYPVYFHAASVGLQGQLTVFGGVDHQNGDSRNNKLTTIWLKIPTLKTICLLALRHYVHEKILDPRLVPSTGMEEAIEVAS